MTNTDRLTPRATQLYVVRWIRRDGRDVNHRYFTRRTDAEALHARLTGYGRTTAIFTTPVTAWTPTTPTRSA